MKKIVIALVGASVLIVWWAASGHRAAHQPGPSRRAPAVSSPAPGMVAERLAVALMAYDWRTAAGGTLGAARPWVTASLLAALASSPGAPALDEQRRSQREIDTVGTVSLTVEDPAPLVIGYAVSAPVTVTSATGTRREIRRYLDIQVAKGPAGWRVAAVQS